MSLKRLYLLDLLQYSVHDHRHPRRLLKRGAGAALPARKSVRLLPQVGKVSKSCASAQALPALGALGEVSCFLGLSQWGMLVGLNLFYLTGML